MARNAIGTVAAERRLRMTYQEYLDWATADAASEWVDGEVTIFMPPRTIHQDLVLLIAQLLSDFLYLVRGGTGKVMIAPYEMLAWDVRSARQPDVLYVAPDHVDRVSKDRLEGPADLVVEVVSDDSVARDRQTKFAEYAAIGVPEYWLVDSRDGHRAVAAYRLAPEAAYERLPLDAAGRLHSRVLPGFWLDPTWLTQDPLPHPLALMATIAPDALHQAARRGLGPPE